MSVSNSLAHISKHCILLFVLELYKNAILYVNLEDLQFLLIFYCFSALSMLLCVAVVYFHWYDYPTIYFYTFLSMSIWIISVLFSITNNAAMRSCTCLV